MSLDPKKLKVGEIVSRTIYAQVLDPQTRVPGRWESFHTAKVRDLKDGTEFYIEGNELITGLTSADQFTEEFSLSLTDVVTRMVNAGEKPFTVCFRKKDGSERILRGTMTTVEPLLGRSTVVDFEVTAGPPLRQVDHRTVLWLILDGAKYTVKGRKHGTN